VFATINDVPTKTSDLVNDGDDGTSHFISLNDLPSNIILYPTTVASDIGGYFKMVQSITDPNYNTVAVDVSTGAISGTAQLISSLATSANVIVGNPGVFDITTIGNIRKVSGSGEAEFFFRVYKRNLAGTETLIIQSNNTLPVTNGGYAEFSATGLWNDGLFVSTDRIVIKYYANRIAGGSNPTYEFQFGGSLPVRTLVPIPLTVVPFITLDEVSDVTISGVANNDLLAYDNATSLWKNKSASTLGIAELASPTFTTDIRTPLIIGGTAVGSNISYKSTSGTGTTAGIAHQFIGGTDGGTTLATLYNNGLVNIGNAVITSQRLVRIGQDTARVDIGSLIGVTSQGAIYLSQGTPSASNYALAGSATVTTLGASSTVQLTVNNVVKTSISSTQITLTPTTACSFSFGVNICAFSMSAVSGGAANRFVYTAGADTNQTASTELREVHYNLAATKTLQTGALTTQRAFSITAPTYAFVGASTITTAATLSVSAAPIAGTNATITNAYALWVQGGKSLFAGNIELTQTVTTETLVSNRTVTIVINGTTYKLLAVI
jgi:hypothetical protein